VTAGVLPLLASLGLTTPADPPGSPSARRPLSADDVTGLLAHAPYEGIACLLGAAVEQGAVVVDDGSAAAILAAWAEAMAGAVQLDALLLEVVRCLYAAGVPVRALKGAAVASLDEVSPSWRSYHDVDVLVPADQLLAAVDALAAVGLRPALAPVSRRWAARFAKSITLVRDGGLQVDVHRLLTPGVFGARLRADSLFAGGQTFDVGGVSVTALGAPHRFLHACYHAALGGVRGTRHRRDVLLLARHVGLADVEPLWADGWSATVVAAALRWAAEDGVQLPGEWPQWCAVMVPDAADQALLATYTGPFGAQAAASVRAVRSPLARIQYSWPLLWPARAHLRDRGRSRVQHVRAVLRSRRLQDRSAAPT